MGTHRREAAGPRGVSRSVIVGAAAVVAVVLLGFGWMQLRDRSAQEATEAARRCVEGDFTLDVAADPTIADSLGEVSRMFNDTSPVIRDRCVTVQVEAVASDDGLSRMTGTDAEAMPNLWIPLDTATAQRVAGRAATTPRSLVASPVVLAARGAGDDALRASNPSWGAVPEMLLNPDGPGLSLPEGPIATSAAAAMLADATGIGAVAPDAEEIDSAAGRRLLANLGAAGLRSAEGGNSDTAANYGDGDNGDNTGDGGPARPDVGGALDRVDADENVVAIATEQQVSQRTDLTAFAPAGSTPVADYPTVIPQPADAGDDASVAIAGDFLTYARDAGMSTLTDAGFVPAEQIVGARDPLAPESADAIGSALADPKAASITTILIDVSAAAAETEGSSTIRSAVGQAVADVVDRLPDTAQVGVVAYGVTESTPGGYQLSIPTTELSAASTTGVGTHRDLITGSLRSWRANDTTAGSTETADGYATVVDEYRTAVADYVSDETNRVLVISVAPNDDSEMTLARATSSLRSAADDQRPVTIDAIVIGSQAEASEWSQVTDATGGRTEEVAGSNGFELPNLLGTLF